MTTISSATETPARLASIDAVRGLVMVIMPLEHAREFFAPVSLADPVDLSTASAGLFLTRLLTHLCAPTFVFLAGLSAALSGRRTSVTAVSRWLLVRGVWLIVLELTVVNFAWTFSFAYPRWFLQVIWALGISMIALAALVPLRPGAILAIGLVIVGGHNLLDGFRLTADSPWYPVWAVLHQRDLMQIAGKTVRTSYPVLPWIGVMALGYCAGAFYRPGWDERRRNAMWWRLGVGLLGLFVLLRTANVYGDASPFMVYPDASRTLFSLFNTTKYPPSLLFTMMTLGSMCLALATSERSLGAVGRVLTAYGRAPLFFYVAHWYVLHLMALGAALLMGATWHEFDFATNFAGLPRPLDFTLAGVYAVAAAAVAILYLPCRWIGDLKQRTHAAWVRFL